MIALKEEENSVSWSSLMSPAYRGPLLAGVGLAVISAFDGINAFMYYSTKIFKLAGQEDPVLASLAVGITNFGASIVALYIVNSYGRRPLMFIGSAGQLIGLVRVRGPPSHGVARPHRPRRPAGNVGASARARACVRVLNACSLLLFSVFRLQAIGAATILQAGTGEMTTTAGWWLVAGLLFFVVNFAYSSGPLTWVVISEVFPMRARGKGAGIATAANWLANYIVRPPACCRRHAPHLPPRSCVLGCCATFARSALCSASLGQTLAQRTQRVAKSYLPSRSSRLLLPQSSPNHHPIIQIALIYPIAIGDGAEELQRQNVGWTMVAFGVRKKNRRPVSYPLVAPTCCACTGRLLRQLLRVRVRVRSRGRVCQLLWQAAAGVVDADETALTQQLLPILLFAMRLGGCVRVLLLHLQVRA